MSWQFYPQGSCRFVWYYYLSNTGLLTRSQSLIHVTFGRAINTSFVQARVASIQYVPGPGVMCNGVIALHLSEEHSVPLRLLLSQPSSQEL